MKTLVKALALLALAASSVCAAQDNTKVWKQVRAKPGSNDCGSGSVALTVRPENADVLVDGSFVGNAPATLKLAPGKHSIKVAAPGYGQWQREVSVLGGSETRLAVVLEKASASAPTKASPASSTPPNPPSSSDPTPSPAPVAPSCGELGAFSDEHPKNRSDGIKLTGFAPRSPAAKAGLEVGDYIVAVAGTYVFTVDDLTSELCKHKPGTQVLLRYRRNAALDETTVVLGP